MPRFVRHEGFQRVRARLDPNVSRTLWLRIARRLPAPCPKGAGARRGPHEGVLGGSTEAKVVVAAPGSEFVAREFRAKPSDQRNGAFAGRGLRVLFTFLVIPSRFHAD